MRFQLTDYQTDATGDVLDAIREAAERYETAGKLSAVSLSAPTGAGKTVVATAVIERLLYGDEDTPPQPETTVVWVTDDPNLNQQTRRKMIVSASRIKPGQLITVDQTLDQETLSPGAVYFIHIQQLGRGATNYVKTGDRRQWSLWDTIANTIRQRGDDFLLIIDEAHRGTGKKPGGSKTITAQLVEGAGGALPPSPVVIGISATPERFVDAITKTGMRTLYPIVVDPEAVRESGLIKDKICIKHPVDNQPGDSTLLGLAVRELRAFDALWNDYTTEQDEPHVMPALVIQVRPRTSSAELKAIVDHLTSEWRELGDRAIAHAFQEHTTLDLGQRTVRYIAPQDVQDDPDLRVVLFKEALTTGWDCPRAEVMLSLRTAADHTYIAQLIGRMVRTPLARRIASNEVLNTVSLYLPHYDAQQVHEVVVGIQSDDSQIVSRIEVDSIACPRNPQVPQDVWQQLADIPTFTRPARNHRSEVARLNALAVLLVGSKLDADATDVARRHLVDTLSRQADRLSGALAKKIESYMHLTYEILTVDLGSGGIAKVEASANVDASNINDLFRRARRVLGDSAAKWYWDTLCDDGVDPDEAKARIAALADDPTTVPVLESAAKTLIDSWRSEYNSAIGELPDAARTAFYRIWQQSRLPEQVGLIVPDQITASDSDKRYPKHLFANGDGLYPCRFSGWEDDVVETELAKGESLIAWYRNPTSGTAALAVPYVQSGQPRTLYPDFLFFHEVDGRIVADVIDPHRPDSADTSPKWLGLAEYAQRFSSHFRRVLAVAKDGDDRLVSLDLKNPDVVTRLSQAHTETDVQNIFSDLGGPY